MGLSTHYNIGCGMSVGRNWINVESCPTLWFEKSPLIGMLYTKNQTRFPRNIRWGDITRTPLCEAGRADAVFCSHMLEHVPLTAMRQALKNIRTMLKEEGIFRLIVPSVESRVNDYLAYGDANAFVEATGLGEKCGSTELPWRIKRSLGNSGHRWMYDVRSMNRELENAGFVDIRECDFGDCEDALFAEVEDLGRFYRNASGLPEDKEVCIECRK